MSIEFNKVADNLFEKIRSRFEDINLGDENAKSTLNPEEARFFNFNYSDEDGNDYGDVTISIIDEKTLKIYYSKDLIGSLDPEIKAEWTNFLKDLRFFAKRNMLTFEPRDINRSGLKHKDVRTLSNTDDTYGKNDINVTEAWSGTRRSSFESKGPVKIIVRHNKSIDEDSPRARSRHIQSIFLETQDGERFKLPENNIKLARAMARHLSEGGSLHDEFGQHILEIAQECAKLRPFKSSMLRRTFEDQETQEMVESAFEYHGLLNNTLKRMSGKKGYNEYKEQFHTNQPLMDDFDADELKERFVKKIYNGRLEDALPVVQKAYNMKKQNKLANQFENWANSIVDEGTWNSIKSEEDIIELKKLLSDPLPVGVDGINAINAIGDLIANDDLFDSLHELADEDSETDARDTILNWLETNEYSVYDQVKDSVYDEEHNDEYGNAMGGVDGSVDEAKGDIRKALTGAALAGGVALGGQALDRMDQQEYANSPQLQKLEYLHSQAVKLGDEYKANELAKRIDAHKTRLSLGKGDVQDASGNPKEIYRESVSDILRLAGLQ